MQAMKVINPPLDLEDEANEVHRSYIEGEATATDFDYPPVSGLKLFSTHCLLLCVLVQGILDLDFLKGSETFMHIDVHHWE